MACYENSSVIRSDPGTCSESSKTIGHLEEVYVDVHYGSDDSALDGIPYVPDDLPPQSPLPALPVYTTPSVPIARKTDYAPHSPSRHEPDSETDSKNDSNSDSQSDSETDSESDTDSSTECSSATTVDHLDVGNAENVAPNVILIAPSGSGSNPSAESVAGPSPKITKAEKFELRNVFVRILPEDLEKYPMDYLKGNKERVRREISEMCHSLRFWLAAKINGTEPGTPGAKPSGALSQAAVCRQLGISPNSFKSYKPKIKLKTSLDFDGLSPLEFDCLTKSSLFKKIKEIALNPDDPYVKNVLNKDRKK